MKKEFHESEADKVKRKINLQKKYAGRITIARQAKDAFQNKDYVNAVKKYNEYLNILAEINEVEDMFKIEPKMFDPQKDLTELLLISHVFWELTKIYEMMPKLQSSFQKTLNQFIRFTINQPYQVLNAEILRRHIKVNKRRSPYIKNLSEAHAQIFVQSKKCFIATSCYGDTHWVTNELRLFKRQIVKTSLGIEFTRLYYTHSPTLIALSKQNIALRGLLSYCFKPLLFTIAGVHRGICLFFQRL